MDASQTFKKQLFAVDFIISSTKNMEGKMKKFRNVWTLFTSLLLLLSMAGLPGCGGGSSSTTSSTTNPTLTTTTDSVTATNGVVTAAKSLQSPTGNSVTIQANTTLTDSSDQLVSGDIPTSVGYSTSTTDLPTAAATLPSGTALAAFLDISIGSAENFTPGLQITLDVGSAAKAGDTVVIYNFSSSTNQWTVEDTLTVASDGTVSFTVRHLSIWAAFTTSTPPPGKPSGVSATAGDSQVTVSWTAPTLGTPTSYNVYYATAADVTPGAAGVTKVAVANAATSTVISGLTNGTTYYFVVTSVNANGESGISSEKSATPAATLQPPASPNGVTLTAGTGLVTVLWNTKPTATSYNIYYAASSSTTTADLLTGTPIKVPATSDPQATTQSFDVTGLTASTTYAFVVTSQNAAGESGAQTNPKYATPN
jgi:hypothetical protein